MDGKNNVLVCITPQESSKRLVDAGRLLAEGYGVSLEVISVLPIEEAMNWDTGDVLEKLFCFAKGCGGEMAVYFSDDPALTVAAHVSKFRPLLLVTGFPGENSNDFVSLIHLLVPYIPVSMVDTDGSIHNLLPFEINRPMLKAAKD